MDLLRTVGGLWDVSNFILFAKLYREKTGVTFEIVIQL